MKSSATHQSRICFFHSRQHKVELAPSQIPIQYKQQCIEISRHVFARLTLSSVQAQTLLYENQSNTNKQPLEYLDKFVHHPRSSSQAQTNPQHHQSLFNTVATQLIEIFQQLCQSEVFFKASSNLLSSQYPCSDSPSCFHHQLSRLRPSSNRKYRFSPLRGSR